MQYIKLSTQEFPLHEADVRLECPDMGDTFFIPPNFAEVFLDPMPEVDSETERPRVLPPKQINGVWRQRWAIVEPTFVEKKIFAHTTINPEYHAINGLKVRLNIALNTTTGDALAAWKEYEVVLNAYIDSYPRNGRIPAPPLFDEAGNLVTNLNSGSIPNVIG